MTAERHTPPVTKWLANEIAVLRGELQQIDDSLRRLHRRRQQVAETLQALSTTAALLSTPQLDKCVPPVQAHRLYGGRGNLREFIVRALHEFPEGLTTVVLVRMATEVFGLRLETGAERKRFHNGSLGRALRKMEKLGLVERLPLSDAQPTPQVLWRWRAECLTLDALREMTEEPTGKGDKAWR